MTKRERDRFSDAAVSVLNFRLGLDDIDMLDWETVVGFADVGEVFDARFSRNQLVRARVYDSLSCDGLGVDEI